MATKRKETNAEIGKRLAEAKKAAKAKRDAIAKGNRYFEVEPILKKYPKIIMAIKQPARTNISCIFSSIVKAFSL